MSGRWGIHFSSCELASRHQAAAECEKAEDVFRDERRRPERRQVFRRLAPPQVVIRGTHQPRRGPPKRVGQRGPLGNRREGNPRERHTDGDRRHDPQDDPQMVDDVRLDPRCGHRQQHGRDPREHAVARGLGIVHPMQGEDVQARRDQIGQGHDEADHWRSLVLNILTMRSVMRNPLTMFAMDANTATTPRSRMTVG